MGYTFMICDNQKLCQNCKKADAEDLHTCPYKEEINDDRNTLCNCCDRCAQECADDI